MTGLLHLDEVGATLGGRDVLSGVCLGPLRPGSVTALLGANAAGKSTLLRRIAGELDGPGQVLAAGRPALSWPAQHPNRPAFVPQDIFGGASLTVLEAVLLGAKQQGAWRVARQELDAVSAWLRLLQIDALAGSELRALSGGQRQLVSIAQALAREPRIVLLDEPTSALDLHRQFELLALLRRLAHEHGLCLLMAIHDLNHALRFADHAAILHEGRIVAFGAPAEVVTPEILARVYRVHARVERCSRGLTHVIVDAGMASTPAQATVRPAA